MRGSILGICLGLLAAIGAISVWPIWFALRGSSLVIPLLITLLMGSRFSRAFICALTAGIILDSYTLLNPAFYTLRYLACLVLAWFLFERWLTNRSLYTALVLTILMTCVDSFLAWLTGLLQGVSFAILWSWHTEGLILGLNILLSAVLFTFVASLTKRFSFLFVGTDKRSYISRYG